MPLETLDVLMDALDRLEQRLHCSPDAALEGLRAVESDERDRLTYHISQVLAS